MIMVPGDREPLIASTYVVDIQIPAPVGFDFMFLSLIIFQFSSIGKNFVLRSRSSMRNY